MKKCIILHINDGKPKTIRNGDFLFVENFPRTEKILNKYLAAGFEVKWIIPDYGPTMLSFGRAFSHSGILVYLEHKDTEDMDTDTITREIFTAFENENDISSPDDYPDDFSADIGDDDEELDIKTLFDEWLEESGDDD